MEYTYEFLKKCHGLRFRATICDKPQEDGIIKVKEDSIVLCYGAYDPGRLFFFERAKTLTFTEQTFEVLPRDFEIVPRDTEKYTDWQVGDKMCDQTEHWELKKYKEVIFRSGELVICKDKDGDIDGGYTCEQLHRFGYRLVLTDIEKQILEEKERGKFTLKDGDICYSHLPMPTIFIKEGDECNNRYYRAYVPAKDYLSNGSGRIVPDNFQISIRPATDAEKQQLFDALAKTGKRWNAEKKVVEDIPEETKTAKHEFKKFDPVLVRCGISDTWRPSVFKRYGDANECPSIVVGGYGFTECVPLNEDTESLIGTTSIYLEGKA